MLPLFREMGLFSAPETAVRAASSSSTLVSRLTQERRLIFHQGCVNTVSFHNDDNGLLISGSDDTQIAVWRWQTGEKLHSFDSHHAANVFQAKSIPTSGFDIVSAGADGDILLHSLHPEGDDNTTPRRLFHHNGAVHKLALLPHDQSVFLSCGEDGVVNSYDLRAGRATLNQLFACRHTRVSRKAYIFVILL
jgi:WD40 repeat protein